MSFDRAGGRKWLEVFAGNAIIFAATSWFVSVPGGVATAWPASGMAVAAIVLFGPGFLSAIFASTLAVTLGGLLIGGAAHAVDATLLALAVAIGNTLEAGVAAKGIERRCRGQDALRRGGDFFRFVAVMAFSHGIGAVIGTTAALAAGRVPAEDIGGILVTWWCVSVVGGLVITPLVFLLARGDFSRFRGRRVRIEAAGSLALLFVAGRALAGYAFFEPAKGFPSAFLIIPVLLLIGFRFRGLGVAFALLVLSAIAVTGTLNGYAAFPGLTAGASLLYTQCFIGIIATVGLGFVAVLDERDDHLAEVESLNAELEAKVAARTRQLERINQELTDTMSVVAHDVRGPVAGIRTLAHHMRWSSLDLSTAEGHELLGEIERTSATAVAMMARLLDLQRAHDRPATPVAADLGLLVLSVCQTYEAAAREKHITLRTTLPRRPVPRLMDIEGLKFIVTNLVSNAVKFLPVGGSVEVRVAASDFGCQVAVIDDGPGLSSEECAGIFQRFVKASNLPTAGESSTGLGLFIVRKLVLAMEGTLYVESARGEGAAFVVEWSAERESALGAAKKS